MYLGDQVSLQRSEKNRKKEKSHSLPLEIPARYCSLSEPDRHTFERAKAVDDTLGDDDIAIFWTIRLRHAIEFELHASVHDSHNLGVLEVAVIGDRKDVGFAVARSEDVGKSSLQFMKDGKARGMAGRRKRCLERRHI